MVSVKSAGKSTYSPVAFYCSRALENYGIISKHYTSLVFILVSLQAKLNFKKSMKHFVQIPERITHGNTQANSYF